MRAWYASLVLVTFSVCPAQDSATARDQKKSAPAPAAAAEPESGKALGPGAEAGDASSATESASAKRNENIYITRIDNNALRDALMRLGASITQITEPGVSANYFAAEFGQAPAEFPFLKPHPLTGWHGELFESLQNSVFNARTFFQVGPVQPSRQNFYGFQLGGRISKGHALSLEGSQRKIRGMVNGNVLVPTPEEREPLATDPAAQAIIRRFLRAFPAQPPNRLDFDPRALNTNSPQSINDDRLSGRWDADLGGSRKLGTQFQYDNQFIRSFQLVAGQNPDTTLRTRTAQVTVSQPFRGSGVWTTGLAFHRLRTILVAEPNAVGPSVAFGESIETLGPRFNVPINRAENSFSAGTQVAWLAGSHRLTAGAEWARLQLNGSEVAGHRGFFAFSDDFGRTAIQNLLSGAPTFYFRSIGDTSRGFRNATLQAYLGDEWRPSARWHLNIGLRYGLETAPHEVHHRTRVPYHCECDNFSPRFGFAYQGNGWGVIRGAYTLSYGQIMPAIYQQARFNPPGVLSVEVVDPDLVDPLRGLDLSHPDANTRSGLLLLAPNLRDPYSHQYSLSWEQQIQHAWLVRLGYVGSRTFQLFMPLVTNRAQPVPGVPLTTDTITDRRPDQRYYEVTRIVNMGNAYLDAAQVSVSLPRRKGLSFSAGYTFGKALDTGADYTSTSAGEEAFFENSQTEFETLKDLKGLSRFDSTHAVLLQASYDLPQKAGGLLRRGLLHGWNISGAALFKSGTPFTVRVGSDAPGYGNVDGLSSDRPDLLDPSILGRSINNPDLSGQQLPRAAFACLQPGEPRGSLGRNTFRKDGIRNFNLALTRQWTLPSTSAERRLLFRAEALNALNHPQFDRPGFLLVNNNFGRITNTLNDGRIFQLSLRFAF